jgi:hypothetical protein
MNYDHRLKFLIKLNYRYNINLFLDGIKAGHIRENKYYFDYVLEPSDELIAYYDNTIRGKESTYIKPIALNFEEIVSNYLAANPNGIPLLYHHLTDEELLQLKLLTL